LILLSHDEPIPWRWIVADRVGERVSRGRRARAVALGLVFVLLVAGAALAWSTSRQSVSVATAVVLLHPLEGNAYNPSGRGDELVNLETEAQVLRSEAVADAVLDRVGGSEEPADLLAAVTVSVPPNTQLVEVSVRAADPATAKALASGFAEVYLEYRRARTESAVYERTVRLEELVDARTNERAAVLTRLDEAGPSTPAALLARQQIEEFTTQISSLHAQIAAAQAVSRDPGQVVTPGAVEEPPPWSDPPWMAALAGGVAALLVIGVGVAGRGRRTADILRARDDLEGLGPPVLGEVRPPVRPDSKTTALVRAAVLAADPGRPHVVAVGSIGRGEALIYPGLVEAFTRARYEVVAVDLGRTPTATAVAQLVLQDAVVADVLVEQGRFLSILRPTGSPVSVRSDELADMVAAAEMARVLDELAKRADIVLVRCDGFDTPLGRALLGSTTTVVAEVRLGACSRGEAKDVVDAAARTGNILVGLVPVRRSSSRQPWRRRRSRRVSHA